MSRSTAGSSAGSSLTIVKGSFCPKAGRGLSAATIALPHSVTTPPSGPGRLIPPMTTKSPSVFITSLGG
jgi:hypothetical protein